MNKKFKNEEEKNSYAATITQGIQPYYKNLDCVNIPEIFHPKAGPISELTDDDFSLNKVSMLTRKRYLTLKRDNFTCACCKRKATKYLKLQLKHGRFLYGFYFTEGDKKHFLNIDHKKPVSLGGSNYKTNTQTMCFYCNSFKADSVPGKAVGNTFIPGTKITLDKYEKMTTKQKLVFHLKQAVKLIVFKDEDTNEHKGN